MEEQLFEWEDVDFAGDLILVFSNVKRKSDGKIFPVANLNYETGELEYLDDEGNILEKYKLTFQLERVDV